MTDLKYVRIGSAIIWCFVLVEFSDSISTIGPTCFSCDREVLPTTCSSVATCGPHETCAMEKGVDLLYDNVFWSGCKDKMDCDTNRRRRFPDDVTVTCSKCCDGNFCNSEGCGEPGFPIGRHVCFSCFNMTSSSNCSHVVMCRENEVCYFEEVHHNDSVTYHSGCRTLPECKMDQWCGGCCLGNFCNSGCHPYDNLRPLYQYVTLTNPPESKWITVPSR
ncbi:uncharacterized protein LOC125658251 isoform X2 [Ostrea edulis]|uniref:uncharacterized protein LOC125658251 isoform X2 n=1 Tax=Ostrea edulis TaxID=37623 RepID=UPI00209571B0|nr:uncharacterized protein LOC125658251 isoform X2 [Ostrea edulis]